MTFTRVKREALRKAYQAASVASKADFRFEGQTFLTRYAKYLLEYLDGVGL